MLSFKELKTILLESLWSANKNDVPLSVKVALDADNTQYWLIKAKELINEASAQCNKDEFHQRIKLAISVLLMARAKETIKVKKPPKNTEPTPLLIPKPVLPDLRADECKPG